MFRPVRIRLSIQTNLRMLGYRYPHRADYNVGFDDNGTLLGIDLKIYEGQGYNPNDTSITEFTGFIDNGIHTILFSQ